ncbi:hypothetical protein BDN71DRAFT_1506217 [Pleurotus eryngii]|uniref:Uncharacterized protein n=1 Tax=Pleurotus eryngii TaxID=5323 RepID=A0A9P5ZXZ2_PLEER|nr:hypothetical protein BDN71DRAFT_1506217 [Pleurotus eryngii]
MPEDDTSPNTLGLAFDQLKIDETKVQASTVAEEPEQPAPPVDAGEPRTEKKKPYLNHERVKTGGAQRDKLTEDELTERMARIKAQNDKIKQRRLDVEADEDAFRKMQESERAKIALNKKVQETVNRTREQNAKRKMDKIQSREWDSGKPAADWKHAAPTNKEAETEDEVATGAEVEEERSLQAERFQLLNLSQNKQYLKHHDSVLILGPYFMHRLTSSATHLFSFRLKAP